MKLRLLPSSFESDGAPSARQHLTCFVINGTVAVDAGSLAMAVTPDERSQIRDIVLTHAHLDHIAGLPLFIDDQFSELTEAIRIHATHEVIEVLERDVFNWSVYPRFSELENEHGNVIEYHTFEQGSTFHVGDLTFESLPVNHRVPCSGFVISDNSASIALTGDTADMDSFWTTVNERKPNALLIECAFPNELADLAETSCHLTPEGLSKELAKLRHTSCEKWVINIKPSYRDKVIDQISGLGIDGLEDLKVGKVYEWRRGTTSSTHA